MSSVVVVGSQWGDEGKGKVVDWLSSKADIVVRFQGGHNAGHTLVVGDTVYKLSLLPSGIVREGTMSVIGSGVVLEPKALFDEIDRISEQGVQISPENLMIAENTPLILPIHAHLDRILEEAKGKNKIGTTGKGIGPAYVDKVARRSLRVGDLSDDELVKHKIEDILFFHNALLRGFGVEEYKFEDLYDYVMSYAERLSEHAGVVWKYLDDAKKAGKKILFEGAQGTLLDIDHGTYPFVTSSNTIAPQAAIGSGVGAKNLNHVLGITKAYTTRVGEGPFPTEQQNNIGEGLGERGHEFGTVTGRKRRCGWFDAVLVRQAIKVSGIDGIALMKLDVLDGMEELKICTGYKLDGKEVDYLPANKQDQARVEPIYESMKGWSGKTYGVRNFEELPQEARDYISRLEALIEVKVNLLSTSPERDDTMLLHDPFAA